MKIERIVFFDSRESVDLYLAKSRGKALAGDTLFIAVRPKVRVYLMKKGLDASDTLRYFTNDSHKRCLDRSNPAVIWMRKEFDRLGSKARLKRAYINSFVLNARSAVNYCLWMTEIITNAVATHNPRILSAHSRGRRFVNFVRILPEERLLGRIVKLVTESRGLDYEEIEKGYFAHVGFRVSLVLTYIYNVAKSLFRYVKFKLWKTGILVSGMLKGKNFIVFTTRKYRMTKLAQNILEKHPKKRAIFLEDPIIFSLRLPYLFLRMFLGRSEDRSALKEGIIDNIMAGIKREESLFSYRGVHFSGLIAEKINTSLKDYVAGVMLWAKELEGFIGSVKPEVVITNGDRHEDAVLAEICRKKKVPNILISHGSHVRPNNEYEAIEWGEHGTVFFQAPFSFLALQTPLSEGFMERFPSDYNPVRTGPLIWGVPVNREESKALFKKIFKDKHEFGRTKIVLHCGTPKGSDNVRLYVYERPDEYIQAIRETAECVRNIPDTFLIVKFRPSFDIDAETLRALVPFGDRVILSVGEPFIEMLGMADLLVSFSSTTIEEALQNRVPVLLYGGEGRYAHVPAYEITAGCGVEKKAVYHVKKSTSLEYALKNILESDKYSGKVSELFDPFVYPSESRVALATLLKEEIFS